MRFRSPLRGSDEEGSATPRPSQGFTPLAIDGRPSGAAKTGPPNGLASQSPAGCGFGLAVYNLAGGEGRLRRDNSRSRVHAGQHQLFISPGRGSSARRTCIEIRRPRRSASVMSRRERFLSPTWPSRPRFDARHGGGPASRIQSAESGGVQVGRSQRPPPRKMWRQSCVEATQVKATS